MGERVGAHMIGKGAVKSERDTLNLTEIIWDGWFVISYVHVPKKCKTIKTINGRLGEGSGTHTIGKGMEK